MAKKRNKGKSVEPYQPTRSPDGYLLWDRKLIQPNPKQPRKYFDPEKMDALKKSIKAVGILTPLRIMPLDVAGNASLVDGERRFRAATELNLPHVPVILSSCRHADEKALFRESVISNFCREDMTEIETARALQRLMNLYDLNQGEVAALVGKTPGWVSNMLKYLKLHSGVADDLLERRITPAMALAASRFPQDKQPAIVEKLKAAKEEKGSALRHEEISLVVARAAQGTTKPLKPKKGKAPEMNPDALLIRALAGHLSALRPKIAEAAELSAKNLEALGGEILIQVEQDLQAVLGSGEKLKNTILKAL